MSPAKDNAELLEIDGREVRISNPDKVVFPEPGLTKLDLVRYYLARRRRRPARGRRPADGAEAVREGHLAGGVLPEARAREAPRVDRHGHAALRVGQLGRGGRRAGCRRARVGREPRLHRPQPASRARRGPRPPRRAARRPRPDAGRGLEPDRRRRHGRARGARRPRARRLAEDLGVARHAHQRRASSRAGPSARCGSPPRRSPARSSSRAPGLATARWWKEERGESVFVDFNQNAKDRTVASAYSIRPLPDARVSTPLDWDEVRDSHPERFTVPTVLAAVRRARRPRRGHRRRRRRTRRACCASPRSSDPPRSRRSRRDGVGGRRGSRPCRSSRSPARRRSPRRSRRLERWKAKHPDVVPCCSRPTCSSTACAASSSLWYRIRVNLQHVPEAQRPEQEAARGRLRPVGRQGVERLVSDLGPVDPGHAGEAAWLRRWRLRPDGDPITTASSTLMPVRTEGGEPAMLKLAHTEEEVARRRPARRARRARRRPRARAQRHGDAARAGHRRSRPRAHGRGRRGRRGDADHLRRRRPASTRHPLPCSASDDPPELVDLPTWFRHLFSRGRPSSAPFHRRGADVAARAARRPARPRRAARRPAPRQRARLRRARVARDRPEGPPRRGRVRLLQPAVQPVARARARARPTRAAVRRGRRRRPALEPARLADWLVAWCALSSTWFALDDDPRLADIRGGDRRAGAWRWRRR